MSPKFYATLWIAFAVVAGILGIGGVLTMFTAVVLGFVAFGLVFAGMICVLPGTVSHPPANDAEPGPQRGFHAAYDPARIEKGSVPFRIRAHR